MSDWPRKCQNCKSDVNVESFLEEPKLRACPKRPDRSHQVENRTYYHPGARDVQDIRDRRRFSPLVTLVPVYDYRDEKTDKTVKTRGLAAQFEDGKFNSDDPEIQYYLELRSDIPHGEAGRKMWEAIYLSPEQQNSIAKAELITLQDKIKEANDSLAKAKARGKDPGGNAVAV